MLVDNSALDGSAEVVGALAKWRSVEIGCFGRSDIVQLNYAEFGDAVELRGAERRDHVLSG